MLLCDVTRHLFLILNFTAAPLQSDPGSSRLQLSIWDHARMKANECTGGMSFSLKDLMK